MALLRQKSKKDRILGMEHYCLMVKSGGEDAFKRDFEKNLKKSALMEGGAQEESPAPSAKISFFKKKMRDSKKREFEEALFPGYVFLSAKSLDARVEEAAKRAKNFYHFLDSNSNIQKLQGSDHEILSNLLKFGETQGISQAYFDKDQRIVIANGPLVGFEGKITKVNRKRGRATVQVDLCSNTMKFDLAFEEMAAPDKA